MIPRFLVPKDLRAAQSQTASPRRLSSFLDSRTLVPAELPIVSLDTRTRIPSHVPLDVLTKKVFVPRDLPITPLVTKSDIPGYLPLTVLDARTVVPRSAQPETLDLQPPDPAAHLPDLLDPDVLTTGEINLLVQPKRDYTAVWARMGAAGSVLFHLTLIVFIILTPEIFPNRPPTQAELDLARRQLGFIYLPPQVTDVPKILNPPSEPPSSRMRVDPRILREIAPPTPEAERIPSAPAPRAEKEAPHPAPDRLPERPVPRVPIDQVPSFSPPRQPGRELARLESPSKPNPADSPLNLQVPRLSPGKALEQTAREAVRGGTGGGSEGFSGPIPSGPGGGAGAGSSGLAGAGVQILTPTQGVDFSNYLARVLASVRRNWYAVIPESARLGEQGRVVLQFRIMQDGNVPAGEPALTMTSGRDHLDRAALSAIRASSPFEPLPSAFSGPFIELRFIFLYNLPLDYQ